MRNLLKHHYYCPQRGLRANYKKQNYDSARPITFDMVNKVCVNELSLLPNDHSCIRTMIDNGELYCATGNVELRTLRHLLQIDIARHQPLDTLLAAFKEHPFCNILQAVTPLNPGQCFGQH